MAERRSAAVHIGELNLRIPGDSAETGHRIPDSIAQGLEHTLPAGMQRHLGALGVRVQVLSGTNETEMSGAVVEAIIRALRRKAGRPREVDE